MRLGCYLGKPNQLRALLPVWDAAAARGWTVRWYGPGARQTEPHPRDVPDVTVSLDPPPPSIPTRWIWLQSTTDPFQDPRLPTTMATLAVYTDWWAHRLPAGVKREVVGFPISKTIPGPPVLVYVPWSVRSGSWSLWRRAQNELHHRTFIRTLAEYVQAAGVPLHVKVRAKDPIPKDLVALAARVIDDESGEGDTLDWLDGAQGCIHMYSGVVLEAAALGVPSLCFDPGPGWGLSPLATNARFGLFNWPGVVTWRDLRVDPFVPPPTWQIVPAELGDYRRRFVGETEGAADRVCALAESMR